MFWTIFFFSLGGFFLWWINGIVGSVESPAFADTTDGGDDAGDDFHGFPRVASYESVEDDSDTDLELSLPYQDDFMFDEGGIC